MKSQPHIKKAGILAFPKSAIDFLGGKEKVFSFSPTLIFQEHAAKCLAGARDKKVMDCKGARRLIPPGDALANLDPARAREGHSRSMDTV